MKFTNEQNQSRLFIHVNFNELAQFMRLKLICCCWLLLILSSVAKAANSGKIRVAMFLEPPFVFLKSEQLVGENIDIANLLANSVNLETDFIRCPFARCMLMMRNGQADMIIGLRKTAERLKYLTFLTPPYRIQHFPLRFYQRADSKIVINSFDDLSHLSIGVLRAATYFDQFDNAKHLNKVEVTSRKQLVNLLLKGRVDTFLEREESILPLLPFKTYQSKLKLAPYAYDHAVESYIAISKQSPIKGYGKVLSANLAKFMKNGTIETIMANRPDVFGTKSEH